MSSPSTSIGKQSMNTTQPGECATLEYHEQDHGLDHGSRYPNTWSRYREFIKEPAAEFLGTAVLVIFGVGAQCQVALSQIAAVSPSPKGSYLSISLGWGIGLALGGWIACGISGGHINPAVTLAFATLRGFPWRKVPAYMIAQLLGALVGAALVYATYFHAIDIFEGGRGVRTARTASLFATYAASYMTNVSAFFSEFLGTALLVGLIFAMTDRMNFCPPVGLAPLLLFFVLCGISISLGMGTGFAVNPARDLGPRLLTSMVGYGKAVYTFRHQYWIWCPIMATFLGGMAGAALYDFFLFRGDESVFNKPYSQKTSRARFKEPHRGTEARPTAGVPPEDVV